MAIFTKRFILINAIMIQHSFTEIQSNLFRHLIFPSLFPFHVQERNFTLKSKLNRTGPAGNQVKEIDLVPFENYI